MDKLTCVLFCAVFSVFHKTAGQAREAAIPCYDERSGLAQRCVPPFQNIAYKKTVDATNTCGVNTPQTYCLQIGSGRRGRERNNPECRICDNRRYELSHSTRFLTDFNNNDNNTWWQSETMLERIQFPNTVNLTLRLGHEFEITYVRLRFRSSRPESMAIYKRTTSEAGLVPYQYYSASCERTYGLRIEEAITDADETKAICTDDDSDIIPLSGENIVFSTLKGRPGAYNFDNNPILQEWVTASEIKIVFTRLNTFGDEIFGFPKVLQSYFYAVSDLAVGGRCKCNGHASECTKSTGLGLEERYACTCEHNTEGANCQTCKPFYNNRPWQRATARDANECQACDCNGLSDRCYFDDALYRLSGQGGHCLECRDNTAGPHCERCKDNYYRRSERDRCQPCTCDPIGSETNQCDASGNCRCKPGVTGQRCDQCKPNFYNLGPYGCRACECRPEGSRDSPPSCETNTGACTCKDLVEGQNCDRCRPGYFGLSADNPLGCMACFCYGHSSVCTSARGYTTRVIHSDFTSGAQGWTGVTNSGKPVDLRFDAISQNVGASSVGNDHVYFLAPARYLGDQRFSYNQLLTFKLRVGERDARASLTDLILEGNGQKISIPIYYQGNQAPRTVEQSYSFRLNEHPTHQWSPSLSSMEFIRLLSNLTAIKIRAGYSSSGVGFLNDVKLESAQKGGSGNAVSHVESCSCTTGYVGQFCESCQPSYYRDPPNGGPLARCIPCNCNGHADFCEAETGECKCQHNTAGRNCERCAPGYYGYALAGTSGDCKKCPCPDNGECVELLNGDVACIKCQEGYTGNRCDECQDGYYGDPSNRRPCRRCECNGNIDSNAVGNCNTKTGECLKCIYNTAGSSCDRCLSGYYGDALGLPKGQCQPCSCYGPGTYQARPGEAFTCDSSGQCRCKSYVIGQNCDSCREGYWNIDSGNGCQDCACNRMGTHNISCDLSTGQCHNKPGVAGRIGEKCMENHYGFSESGCLPCDCDPSGSLTQQCDRITGRCVCKPGIQGEKCNQCEENKYNISAGCIDCPACYNLVQDAVNLHRRKINELRIIIKDIGSNPQDIDDAEFRAQIRAVNESVNQLLEDAERASGQGDGSVAEQLQAMREALMEVMDKCNRIALDIMNGALSSQNSMRDIAAAERALDLAEDRLKAAEELIDNDGRRALEEAKKAQEKAGQQSQQLTQIAKRAREMADRHEAEADEILSIAKQALNTSETARDTAVKALDVPFNTGSEILIIENNLKNAQSLLGQTKDLARMAREEAMKAFDEALNIQVEVDGLTLPDVNVDELNNKAEIIKNEAASIKQEAADILTEQQTLLDTVAKQQVEAEALLAEGERQQQRLDELFADADKAREIALDAVERARKTLRDAQEMLERLKAFEETVRISKEKAQEALAKIPEIEDRIEEAESTTAQARANLDEARRNAEQARDIAEVSKATAEMASETAQGLKNETQTTKVRAQDGLQNAQRLDREVDNVESLIGQFENQARDDKDLAREALEKAGRAKTLATGASDDVDMAINTLEEIMRQLNNLDRLDMNELNDLEATLIQTEATLNQSDINVRFQEIRTMRDRQTYYLNVYITDLKELELAVENLAAINQTLFDIPCQNKQEIEPTNVGGGGRRRVRIY